MIAAPGTMFGRYRIEQHLGAGGMGVVYRAWDPQLARPVAIKVVQPAADDDAGRARLVREAQSLARVSHPHVCQVYDVGTEGDEVWVAMELIENVSLRRFAEDASRAELLAVLLEAAEGIAAAHDASIIHRDVKPENVLVELARASQASVDPVAETVPGPATVAGKRADGDAVTTVPGHRDAGDRDATTAPSPGHRDATNARETGERGRNRRTTGASIARAGAPRRAVVTDFGLARLDVSIDPVAATMSSDAAAQLTATGALAGTPAYLAPEQLTGSALDARVDQFAWAVMCWELVTGMRPFPILAGARLEAVRAGLTPPPALDRRIAAALCRALQMAPRERFATMHDLIDAIRTAHRPARSRRPLALAAAAAGVAGTIAVWQLTRPPATAAAPATASNPASSAAASPASSTAQSPASNATTSTAAPAMAQTVRATDTRVRTADSKVRTPDGPVRGSDDAIAALDAALAAESRTIKPLDRERGVAMLDSFCHLPYDAAHPDPATSKPWMDWGKVTRREIVVGKIGTAETTLLLYEVVGQRATYRFNGTTWAGSAGVLDAPVGSWVALCQEDIAEIYKLPPAWQGPLGRMAGFVGMSRPPRIGELAKLEPLHLSELSLRVAAEKRALAADRRYVIWARPEAADGDNRWFMGQWWLEVPPQTPGAHLVAAGKRVWFVVERPTYEDQPEGKPPRLVLHAAAVLDEMFPR